MNLYNLCPTTFAMITHRIKIIIKNIFKKQIKWKDKYQISILNMIPIF